MELKTLIGIVLAIVWFFIKTMEAKATATSKRVNAPLPPDNLPPIQPVQASRTVNQVKKVPEKYRRESIVNKNSSKISGTQAAFDNPMMSSIKIGGIQAESTQMELIDQEENELADEIRLKIQSPQGAREAFIYSEILQPRTWS